MVYAQRKLRNDAWKKRTQKRFSIYGGREKEKGQQSCVSYVHTQLRYVRNHRLPLQRKRCARKGNAFNFLKLNCFSPHLFRLSVSDIFFFVFFCLPRFCTLVYFANKQQRQLSFQTQQKTALPKRYLAVFKLLMPKPMLSNFHLYYLFGNLKIRRNEQ